MLICKATMHSCEKLHLLIKKIPLIKIDTMKKLLSFTIMLISIFSCDNNSSFKEALSTKSGGAVIVADDALDFEEEMEYEPPRTAEPVAPPSGVERNEDVDKQSKIIKDGRMTLEVDSLEIAKRFIDSIVQTSTAYYEREEYSGGYNTHRYTLKVRVPNINFESFVSLLETGSGKVINKSINAKDVTAEYVDLKIRLDNNRAYLDQYKALLKKAKKVEEILQIQEKARRIEGEIDAQLGRMKFINDQVKYSTLNIDVYQKIIHRNTIESPSYLSKLWGSVQFGFYGIQEVILWIVALWPFILLLLSGIFFVKVYRKRKKV